jgi:hypothetical protein
MLYCACGLNEGFTERATDQTLQSQAAPVVPAKPNFLL